ncbi:MAG: hypothetical protein ABI690_30250 [Chloroflexota bacterium]
MDAKMNQLQNIPPIKWMSRHPRLAAWIILSVGMVVLLVIEAKDVGLLATQWAALVIATVLVAGACVWIISWEDSDEALETNESAPTPTVEASQPSDTQSPG